MSNVPPVGTQFDVSSMLWSVGPAAAVIGTAALAYKYVANKIGKPAMAMEQRRTTIFTPFTSLFRQDPVVAKTIFNPQLTARLEDIADSTKDIKAGHAYFQHVILFGPPGTGKTMAAKQIARESDMDFIMMSGAELTQFIKSKDHVTELNSLLDSAENGWNPTVVFIDEVEGLAKHRKLLDHEHVELLDALLSRTGTPSKKLMLILATNRIEDIDSAVLSRMSHKIEIGKPELEERIAIIQQYAKELFPDAFKYFDEESIQQIAMKTEGFAGREIFNLINAIRAADSRLVSEQRLPQDKFDQIVDAFVDQENNLRKQLASV